MRPDTPHMTPVARLLFIGNFFELHPAAKIIIKHRARVTPALAYLWLG